MKRQQEMPTNAVDMLQEGQRCQKLWVSVIEQAILDASYTKGTAKEQNARDLPRWLDSVDFGQIILWAGLMGAEKRIYGIIEEELEKSSKREKKISGRNKTIVRRYTERQVKR